MRVFFTHRFLRFLKLNIRLHEGSADESQTVLPFFLDAQGAQQLCCNSPLECALC